MSDAIGEGLKIVSQGLDIAKDVTDRRNAADVRAAAIKQDEIKVLEDFEKALAEGNLEAVQIHLAE
jgi:hypothetical protein